MKGIKRFFTESPLRGKRFRVRGIGIHESMERGLVNRPRGTGDYLMMCFHTPASVGEWGVVPADTFYMWAPGEHQYYGRRERGFVHSWLHCEGDMVARWHQLIYPKGGSLLSGDSEIFVRFLENLYAEICTHEEADEIIAENLLTNWARQLHRKVNGGRAQNLPERLKRVKDFIDEHHRQPLTLQQLAKMAHWSVAHFSEEFRRHLGDSPINYVIRARMHHAKYLLRDVNLSITEVGARVGYESLYHFSKIFKNHYQMSPRAFRNQHLSGDGSQRRPSRES